MRVRVYALVSGGTSLKTFRTSQGERLRLLRRGTIAAVVSDHSKPASPTSSNLRRYDRTMREIAAKFPAILPARFGTAVGEDELMFILSSRRASLMRTLAAVRGRVQMTIRVITRGGRQAEPRTGRRAPFHSASTGRDYLAGKARDATAARAVPDFEPVSAAVARWVRDERVERRGDVANVYHLIPRSSLLRYVRTVQIAAAAAGLRLTVSGPWPPYAFVG